MTPFTCDGRTRLNVSQEKVPNASGDMNSVASTSPKRSTTVSQKIDEMSQCLAAPSGNGNRRRAALRPRSGGSSTIALEVVSSAIAPRAYERSAPSCGRMTNLSFARHLRVIRCMFRGAEMPILVVEDEPRILAFVRRGLEAQGFVVDAAGDGATGLRRARERRYDLVVLDLLLPGLDGLTVLRELAQKSPDLPVLILSARADLQ